MPFFVAKISKKSFSCPKFPNLPWYSIAEVGRTRSPTEEREVAYVQATNKKSGEVPAAQAVSREKKAPRSATKGREQVKEASKSERAKLEKIWSRRMALCGLKRIFEAAIDGARVEIRDEDGALVEVKFNPTAANAATKAIEVANRMLGYTAPEENEDADGLLFIDFGNAEELAE